MQVSKRTKYAKSLIGAIAVLLACGACSTKKYLGPGEYLLKGNSIELQDEGKLDQKRAIKYELSTLYKQTENNRFLFMPREWFYYATEGKTSKFSRWQRRVIAEEPVINNDSLVQATEQAMVYYLQYQGYFDAEVKAQADNKPGSKKIRMIYEVDPKARFTVDTIAFFSEDTTLNRKLQDIARRSLLRKGAPMDGKLYERERDRITRHLRNNGYAYFFKNYIAPLEADTSVGRASGALKLEVLLPPEDSVHHAYVINSVSVYMDYTPGQTDSIQLDSMVNGLRMLTPRTYFRVKPETILNAVHLREGELYSQSAFDLTNKQLSSLGVFRFVRIKQDVDTLLPDRLNFRIELTQNKRMELGMGADISYASRSASGVGNLIGVGISPSFRNRNLLKGAELLVVDANAGLEFNPDPSAISGGQFWNTVDVGLATNLYLPRFSDYLSIWRRLDRARLGDQGSLFLKEGFYQSLKENASTRISANYNYLLILDFYQYNLFTGTYGFEHQPTSNRRLNLNHLGIDYLLPSTEANFESLLRVNPFLERSFGEQLFVSLLFRDLNYAYNSRPNRQGNSHYIGFNVELAGAEIWAGNAIYNSFSLEPDTLRVNLGGGKKVDFSQYARLQIDLRRYWQRSTNQNIAARFFVGAARPFGYTSDVPYVKQFFAGGPNGIRAWAPRGLGPGAYEDTLSVRSINNARLYQTGDFRLEASLEYRFKIFWMFNGAFFLDAGNIWTFQRDENRCGAQFLLRERTYACADQSTGEKLNYTHAPFYQQIAVGGGFGLRLDFSFFILRLDMATKLRHAAPFPNNPDSPDNWQQYWFRDFRADGNRVPLRFIDIVAFNLGFGYPF